MLSITLLGNFHLSYNGLPVTEIDSARLQSLLAYLLLHQEAPQSRAYLAYLFWPDTSEAQARTNLRNLLHHLKRALPAADRYIEAGVQTLQWRTELPYDLDVATFRSKLKQAAEHKNELASLSSILQEAVSCYQGDLLPNSYDDWVIPIREELRQEYIHALEQLVSLLEEQRDYPGAIHYAQTLLRHDPLREATYRSLMRLFALHGDRAGALRVYHACTTTLQRELEVEPSAATRDAYVKLMGEEVGRGPVISSMAAVSPLVGRDADWKQILRAWHWITAGAPPQMILLCGEAGIGKTRLVEELLQWATRQGITVCNTRCYAAEGDLAYSPVIAWLRSLPLANLEDIWLTEVARLLPEILTEYPHLAKPDPLTEAWQRQRLFEALGRAFLKAKSPLLLTIDDLQWCDRDTLEWLHFFLRFEHEERILVVGTYRPEEIEPGHPLIRTRQALKHEGQLTELELQPLDKTATQSLAAAVSGVDINPQAAQSLYQETEGNPLFVVETVRAGMVLENLPGMDEDQPEIGHNSIRGAYKLPHKVQVVLEARLAQLTPATCELAGLAATIGREFSFELLAESSDSDEHSLVRQLDELWQRRIVREHLAEGYDFSHDKLREVAYNRMSPARRKLLHRHVAMALERLHASDLDRLSRQIASHYERAGLTMQAAPYYLRAAQVARQVFANDEATDLLKRGIQLIDCSQTGSVEDGNAHKLTAQLWEELGDILELRAQHEDALRAYQKARAQARFLSATWLARLYCKESTALREQRQYESSLQSCQNAEQALGNQPDERNNQWWDQWLEVQMERVWTLYWLAQWPEMEGLVDRLKVIVQARGKGYNRMRFLMASCLMHLRRGRYVVSDEMLENTRQAYAYSLEWGSLKHRVECQFENGFLLLWRHELDRAEEYLQPALENAKTYGIVPIQTLCLTYLTILHRFRGEVDEVIEYSRLAQEMAETAQMPDYVATAKGNQAWVAWCRQDLSSAEQGCQEALAIWARSPLVYPFQWVALWPLIAINRAKGDDTQTWTYLQAILEPTQQRLPEGINNKLEATVMAMSECQPRLAEEYIDQAMELAHEMGYL